MNPKLDLRIRRNADAAGRASVLADVVGAVARVNKDARVWARCRPNGSADVAAATADFAARHALDCAWNVENGHNCDNAPLTIARAALVASRASDDPDVVAHETAIVAAALAFAVAAAIGAIENPAARAAFKRDWSVLS